MLDFDELCASRFTGNLVNASTKLQNVMPPRSGSLSRTNALRLKIRCRSTSVADCTIKTLQALFSRQIYIDIGRGRSITVISAPKCQCRLPQAKSSGVSSSRIESEYDSNCSDVTVRYLVHLLAFPYRRHATSFLIARPRFLSIDLGLHFRLLTESIAMRNFAETWPPSLRS